MLFGVRMDEEIISQLNTIKHLKASDLYQQGDRVLRSNVDELDIFFAEHLDPEDFQLDLETRTRIEKILEKTNEITNRIEKEEEIKLLLQDKKREFYHVLNKSI